ncbi:unnamed protein product, partial [Rotaria sordida]
MHTYLTIISFILFIYVISGRPNLLSSSEDDSNEIQLPTNLRNLNRLLFISRLRTFLNDNNEDKETIVRHKSDDDDQQTKPEIIDDKSSSEDDTNEIDHKNVPVKNIKEEV